MKLKVSEVIVRQVKLLKKNDSCYQKVVLVVDAEKILGLDNCFISMAREAVLSVWFIIEFGRLCVRVQPLFYHVLLLPILNRTCTILYIFKVITIAFHFSLYLIYSIAINYYFIRILSCFDKRV